MSAARDFRRRERQPEPPPVINGRQPPANLDCEASALEACMTRPEKREEIVAFLKPEHFYSTANGRIFEAVVELGKVGSAVDPITVGAYLLDRGHLAGIGGNSYLLQIVNETPFSVHPEQHAEIVVKKWRLRQLIATCQKISAEGYGDVGDEDEFIDSAEQALYALANSEKRDTLRHVRDIAREVFADIVSVAERGDRFTGRATGYEKLDAKTAGLHDGDLTIIAARPGMGKTSLAMNIATNVAAPVEIAPNEWTPGDGVIVFSLEMPEKQLTTRMICSEGRIDLGKWRTATLQPDDWRRTSEATSFVTSLPLWIDDTTKTLLGIRAKVRRLQASYNHEDADPKKRRRIGLVVIDYLQLMSGDSRADNREQEISEISRGLKSMAKDLGVPVVALSQLNRSVETRPGKDKRPQLSDLRESGAIEQDADNVIFVFRDEYYTKEASAAKGIAEVIIAKQRSGPTGTVFLKFHNAYTRFDNLSFADYPEDAPD